MASEAKAALGTKLIKDYGTGDHEIAELTNINGLDLSADEIDVTNHQSPDGFEEVIQSIKRTGEVSLEGNFVPGDTDGQIALWNDFVDSLVDDYAIEFPAAMATVWEFKAFVSKPPATEAPVDGKVPFSATLRVTGRPSLAITYSNNLSNLTGIEEEMAAALDFVPDTFAGDTYKYTTTVDTLSTWIKLTPTAASGVITVNGNVVPSGSESGAIGLGDADTTTTVKIKVKETNKIARNYKVIVSRP